MRFSRLYYRHTRRGRVYRVSRERYLRDDIGCLSELCPLQGGLEAEEEEVGMDSGMGLSGGFSDSRTHGSQRFGAAYGKLLSARPKDRRYIVVDTNVCIRQIDMLELECDALRDVVIPQSVAEEVRHRNTAAWSRLKALINSQSRRFVYFPNTCHSETFVTKLPSESPNDYNDRCIRRVCSFYNYELGKHGLQAVLLSDDRECRRLAKDEGIQAMSSHDFVKQYQKEYPRLADLLVRAGSGDEQAGGRDRPSAPGRAGATSSQGKRYTRFDPHLGLQELETGLRSGSLLSGSFRVNRECWFEGNVSVRLGQDVGQHAAQQLARIAAQERSNGRPSAPSSSSSSSAAAAAAAASASDSAGSRLTDRLARAWELSRRTKGESASSKPVSVMQILVRGSRDVNRATDGDQVALRLLPVQQWKKQSRKIAVAPATGIEYQAGSSEADAGTVGGVGGSFEPDAMARAMQAGFKPTAEVVGVLRRAWRPLCGSIEEDATAADGGGSARDGAVTSLVFVPVDPRFPRARIRTTQAASLAGYRIVVGLDGWRCTSAFPDGHLIRIVGPIGDRETETEVLLLEHDIPSNDFTAEVMACLPPPTWNAEEEFPSEEAKGRVDCRGLTVCSIDPPGCKDIDDALHARELWLTEAEAEAGIASSRPTVYLWRPGCAQEARGAFATYIDRDQCQLQVSKIPVKELDRLDLDSDARTGTLQRFLELGVHIADVTHFVQHNAPIDVEAAKRGNTTYLTERRLDMLPKLLTETLCSLRDDGPRFSFSVTWLSRPDPVAGGLADVSIEPQPAGQPGAAAAIDSESNELPEFSYSVVRTCFHKSMVLSKKAMTYQQAYDRLIGERARIAQDRVEARRLAASNQPPVRRRPDPLDQGVSWIADVARFLRRKRIEAGALTLASPEVRFLLDSETHEPITVQAYQHKETNRTVEEFMLWANISVAARTTEVYPRCAVLRRHPAPQPGAFDGLVAAAKSVGIELETSSSKALATSLDEAVSSDNPWLNKILRILATRCMQQAVYFPSGECSPAYYLHYGLATPIYTHFTSPIRRYADVMVHRLLAGCIEQGILPHEYEDRYWMRRVTGNLNTRHYNSYIAGRASAALFTQIFFAGKPKEEEALVLRVRRNGIVVLVPSYGLEGSVMLVCPRKYRDTDAEKQWAVHEESELELNAEATSLTFTPSSSSAARFASGVARAPVTIKLFDKVRILLSVYERDRARQRHELTYRLVDPPLHAREDSDSAPVGSKRVAPEPPSGSMPYAGSATKVATPKKSSGSRAKKRRR